jgi:hypothetical protein
MPRSTPRPENNKNSNSRFKRLRPCKLPRTNFSISEERLNRLNRREITSSPIPSKDSKQIYRQLRLQWKVKLRELQSTLTQQLLLLRLRRSTTEVRVNSCNLIKTLLELPSRLTEQSNSLKFKIDSTLLMVRLTTSKISSNT